MNIHTPINDLEPTEILWGLAKEALEKNGGDTQKATKWLARKLQKDKALLESCLYQAIYSLSGHLTQLKVMSERAAVIRRANAVAQETRAGGTRKFIEAGVNATMGLFDLQLRGGVRLYDATWEQVRETRQDWNSRANSIATNVRFLDGILKKESAGTRPSAVFTVDDLQKIWNRTSQEAA